MKCKGKGEVPHCLQRTEALKTSNNFNVWLERRDDGSVVVVTRNGEKGRITEELKLKPNKVKVNYFYSNFTVDLR